MKRVHLGIMSILAWSIMATGTDPIQEPSAVEKRAAARKELLGSIPPTEPGLYEEKKNSEGSYIYEATSVKPIVEGAVCEIEADKIVKGLTVVRLEGFVSGGADNVRNVGAYWTLGKIEPAEYRIGVCYQSGDSNKEASQGWYAPVQVYLNGRLVQLATHSNPVQVVAGMYFAEAYSAEKVALRPGDELTVGLLSKGTVARIILSQKDPEIGPYRVATSFGGFCWNPYTSHIVNVEPVFVYPDGKAIPSKLPNETIERRAADRASILDAEGNAKCDFIFSNPLPIPVKIKYDCVIRSYYYEVAAKEEGELTIKPHCRVVKTLKYKWKDADPAYLAFANLRGVNTPSVSDPRDKGGLGWPKHEISQYFPQHRQLLPWKDPFAYRVLRRLTLIKTDLGMHGTISLDNTKEWERALTTDLEPPMPPPAGLEFKKVRLPYSENTGDLKPRPHGVYLKTQFELPENIEGRSFKLTLNSFWTTDEVTAYVNGKKVGNVRGGRTPLYCDITSAAKPGSNELIVVVRDLIALMNPEYVKKDDPVGDYQYLDAPGYHSGRILSLSGASIESGPSVASEDIFALPSVRKKTLEARLVVGNRSKKPVRAIVKATVLDEGKPILEIGQKEIELAPDSTSDVNLQSPWENPRLWGPADPHLYALGIEIKDAETGKVLDFQRQRFGFRETWVEGPHIMFNGNPIRPKGAPRATVLSPDPDYRFVRGNAGDVNDEAGIVASVLITQITNSMSQHNARRRQYWEAAEKNALISMREWRNRPSLIGYDLSNEWLCFAAPLVDDIMVPARYMKKVSDAVRAADPSRFTFFDGDRDLEGLLDIMSFHYMSPYIESQGFGMRGHFDYFPDGQFWRPLDRRFTPGEEVPENPFHRNVILRRDKKAMMNNEHLWKVGDLMPPGTTQWGGEDTVLSPAVDNSSGPIAWMYKTRIEGNRDLGIAPVNAIYGYHPGVQRGAFLAQTFLIPENQRNAFSGRTETRRYSLLNGNFVPGVFLFSWHLRYPAGKIVDGGEFKHEMKSGGHECGEISFKVPELSEPAQYTLFASLTVDNRFVVAEEWDIKVFPDKAVTPRKTERKIVLFDPSGATAKTLERAGLKFEKTENPGMPAGKPEGILLVLGEDGLDEKNVEATKGLVDFVEKGGRALVLRQNLQPENLPVVTSLEPRYWASQVHVRMGEHPVMKGLDSMDFHFWQADRAVATGAYTKPVSGNYLVLADIGSGRGMEETVLFELFRGKGEYFICQLPLIAKYDIEPMTREVLARIISYAGTKKAFFCPTGKVDVLALENSVVLPRLADIEASHEALKENSTWDGKDPLIIEIGAARKLGADKISDISEKIKVGGTAILLNPCPEDEKLVSDFSGNKAKITVPPLKMWEGRGYRRGWSRWTAGLSHLDFYWKRFDGGETSGGQAEDPSYMIEPLQGYSVKIDNAKELVFPGALVEVSIGKGTLLVDQRRWWTSNEALGVQSSRNISALLNSLNVRIAPVIPPKKLPAKIAYRPIDISPYANRNIADDMPEDGKGGFTDQGPRCDFRAFPTGKQIFKGVPFQIGKSPNVCIVLASTSRPGYDAMPKEITIPVGFPVEGFYFMHTTAWGGRPSAIYSIEYEDGGKCEIPLMNRENIHDWAGPKPFLREKGTKSVTAWIGKNEVFQMIAAYQMLWTNPKPEVPVKQIRFIAGKTSGVPVQLGMTAVVNGEIKVNDQDIKKAKELLEEAKNAESANKSDDALRLLKEAVSKNPNLGDAYRAMLDVAGKTHDEEKVFDAAWTWGLSPCAATTPWNKMGEILEKRGDKRGALEAYVKSLGIEWNQPPIMDARRRLEANLK